MARNQLLASDSLVFIVNHRTPGRIYVDGKPVFVQFLQYQLATLLAEHPGVCVPYDTVNRELWESKNRIVEPNQIHYQVRKLRKAINESVNHRDKLIKTITKHGLVLDLSPDQVLIVPLSPRP